VRRTFRVYDAQPFVAPEEQIEGPIQQYHVFGHGLPKILKLVQSDFNQDEFGLGYVSTILLTISKLLLTPQGLQLSKSSAKNGVL
jgi:hypothetical protein